MNTRIQYLYRDGSNYKKWAQSVISGEISMAQVEPLLLPDRLFIPSEVGLKDLQEEPLGEDDHIWHELQELEYTDAKPDAEVDADAFMHCLKKTMQRGWEQTEVFKRKGMC